MPYTPTGDRNMFASLKRTMEWGWFGNKAALSQFAQAPTIANGEYVTQLNPTTSGVQNLLGTDAKQQIVEPWDVGISITSAQILAMNGTPVTLVAAPGAGKAIYLKHMALEIIRTSTAYAAGGNVIVAYSTTPTVTVIQPILAAVVTGGAGAVIQGSAGGAATNGAVIVANDSLVLTNLTAAFTTGTGTARVFLEYSIITL